MTVTMQSDTQTMTVLLAGELDHHGAGQVREAIDRAVLQKRCRILKLDFSGLTFMDSSGIGLIMGRYRLMHSLNGTLRIIGVSERLNTILKLAGLEKLPIWGNEERRISYETHQ